MQEACPYGAGPQVERPDHECIQNVHFEEERIFLCLLVLCEEGYCGAGLAMENLGQECLQHVPFSIERISLDH